MHYECLVRRSKSDEIAVTVRESQGPPTVRAGTVLLEVERSVVDVGHLGQILAREPTGQNWQSLGWCSLSGRVAQIGDKVEGIQVGDQLSAIGPLANCVVLPVQECCALPDNVAADQAAWWALLIALVRSVRRLRIEIGESVLVLGGGITGCLIAQLSLVAGAAYVVGLDLVRTIDDKDFKARGSGVAPTWIARQDALQSALPSGQVDVLIDALGDLAQFSRLLSLTREGGRAMSLAVNDTVPSDFDFYPNVHRRSLKWISGTLRSALRQSSNGRMRYDKEAGFASYLFGNGRLGRICQEVAHVYPIHLGEQILPISDTKSLVLQWIDHD